MQMSIKVEMGEQEYSQASSGVMAWKDVTHCSHSKLVRIQTIFLYQSLNFYLENQMLGNITHTDFCSLSIHDPLR